MPFSWELTWSIGPTETSLPLELAQPSPWQEEEAEAAQAHVTSWVRAMRRALGGTRS